jgi:hypothetical protein
MSAKTFIPPLNTARFTRLTLIAGVVALAIGIAGWFISGPELFFQAYLYSFLFWLGVSLGSLGLLLLYHVANGRWGLAIRRVTEAAAGSIWVMAILFIPLVFSIPYLYPWANGLGDNPVLAFKAAYLSMPFWLVRAVIFFAIWIAIAWMMNRRSARLATASSEHRLAVRGRTQAIAAVSLLIFVITMTFASFDWIMSLQPLWTSTAFGLITIVGQALTALAFAILLLNLFPTLSLGHRWTTATTPIPYKDLGALLLVFVMGWMYLQYFQFAILWGANIPREVIWYQDRSTGGWLVVNFIIVIFQFVLPFLMLLTSRVRHNLRILAGLGAMLLLVYLVTTFWHVKPAFSPGVFTISWLDIVMPVAIGGIWLAGFFFNLAKRPALTAEDEVVLEAVPAAH